MHEPPDAPDWWADFYECPDSVPLSSFPTDRETRQEVSALARLLDLRTGLRVADICCGAGRHLVPLAVRGLRMTGVDASAMMLGRAREATARAGVAALLLRGDARRLPFRDAGFDVALNLFNSFGYCETDEENEQVIREAARVLCPGGQFLLETRNPQFQILFAPVSQRMRGADGTSLLLRSTYDLQRRRLVLTWSRPTQPDRPLHRAGMRLYQPDELEQMAARAGLEAVGTYGDLEGTPYEGWERLLVCHWRRR